MILGFLIWSIVCIALFGIGIYDWRAEKAVGFFTGSEPPKVKDVKKYNHAVAKLWFGYAIVMELFGIPLLFVKQNSAWIVLLILGTVFASIGLAVIYVVGIEGKYVK